MNKGLRSTSLSFGTTYQNIATMVGGLGLEARTVEEVEEATRRGFGCGKVCVVNVIVGKGEEGKLEFGQQPRHPLAKRKIRPYPGHSRPVLLLAAYAR